MTPEHTPARCRERAAECVADAINGSPAHQRRAMARALLDVSAATYQAIEGLDAVKRRLRVRGAER